MEITDAQLSAWLHQYFLPFIRIGAMFMVMPVLSTRAVPARARLLLAWLTTFLVAPLLPPFAVPELLSLQTSVYVLRELLIGGVMGFTFMIMFQVFTLAGQYMAMKMGLGFASMNDPANGVQTTVLPQFFITIVTLLFITSNGHLIMTEMIVQSMQTLPPGGQGLSSARLYDVVMLGGWMFSTALVIALPILTALLVINIAFGVMSRAAPQLNIFAVGFPFTLICGMVLIWIGLENLIGSFEGVFEEGFQFARNLLEL